MPKFACCEWTGRVWQVDSTNPSLLPYPVHKAHSDVGSLAFRADKQFDLAWGTTPSEIRRTSGPFDETPVYDHHKVIWRVRVRNVAGTNRVYFSAPKLATNLDGVNIHMLKDGAVSLYTTIDPTKLTFPHPCGPTLPDAYWYGGDFTFGDGNMLYLSTGNWSGFKIGIYRIAGAGPDAVSGVVERIFLTDGPIGALCFESPHTLHFLRGDQVWKLDLSTMTEMFEFSIKLPNGLKPLDITLVGTGLLSIWWWAFISVLKGTIDNLAAALWRTAEALVGTRRGR
jgi:hypothetical protein